MIKRYCDRCGQQIDEGVHAWYVLELHGTDGKFRHKELCEECYAYLCEKDEVPTADRKTENSSEISNNCEDLQDWKDRMWTEAMRSCGFNVDGYRQGQPKTEPTTEDCSKIDKDINVRSKDEPQTDCAWK